MQTLLISGNWNCTGSFFPATSPRIPRWNQAGVGSSCRSPLEQEPQHAKHVDELPCFSFSFFFSSSYRSLHSWIAVKAHSATTTIPFYFVSWLASNHHLRGWLPCSSVPVFFPFPLLSPIRCFGKKKQEKDLCSSCLCAGQHLTSGLCCGSELQGQGVGVRGRSASSSQGSKVWLQES